jgi:hypothetical protein
MQEPHGETSRDVSEAEKRDLAFEPTPRYWMPEQEVEERLRAKSWNRGWLMGWRNITNATNERTVVAGLWPYSGVGHSCQLWLLGPNSKTGEVVALYA